MTDADVEAPNLGGRPPKYRPEFDAQAEKLCRLGATDADLADFFGVCIRTVERWRVEHDGFCRAIKVAKEVADDRVERSLYMRAVGYQTDAVKIFQYDGKELIVPYRENIQPDTTAAIFWLKNRKSDQWRDTSRRENTGPDGGPQELKHSGSVAVSEVIGRIARLSARAAEDGDPGQS